MTKLGRTLKVVGGFAIGAYLFVATVVMIPYYNWQYAKDHGFVRWLVLGQIVPTAKSLVWPYFVFFSGEARRVGKGDPEVVEYSDNEYNYAFQFPSDWKFEKPPQPGEAGEVRVKVKHPVKPMGVMAIVGDLGKSFTKRQFEDSQNRDTVVQAMIDYSIEQFYKKTSRDVGATRMIVAEKKAISSNVGIKFYISTAHFSEKVAMLVAGMHIIPFGKPHLISFVMITPVDKTATKDNETITRVFNSFHVIGENPQ